MYPRECVCKLQLSNCPLKSSYKHKRYRRARDFLRSYPPSITGRIRSSGQLTKYMHILRISVFDYTERVRACSCLVTSANNVLSIPALCLRVYRWHTVRHVSTRFMHDLGLCPGWMAVCWCVRWGRFRVHSSLLAGQRATHTHRERERERERERDGRGEQVHRPEIRGKLLIFVYLLSRLVSRASAANATPSLGTTGTPCIRRQWS